MVVQRPLAQGIAREHETAAAQVPDRKGEVADDAVEAAYVPTLEGRQQDRSVAERASERGRHAKRGDEVVAVIESDVGDQHELAGRTHQRLRIVNVFRQQPEQRPADGDKTVVPLLGRIGPVDFLRRQHAGAGRRGVAPAAQTPHAGDGGHL